MRLTTGGFTVELDARLLAQWEAAERVSLFDALVASGWPVEEAVLAVHPECGGAARLLAALAEDEEPAELREVRA